MCVYLNKHSNECVFKYIFGVGIGTAARRAVPKRKFWKRSEQNLISKRSACDSVGMEAKAGTTNSATEKKEDCYCNLLFFSGTSRISI